MEHFIWLVHIVYLCRYISVVLTTTRELGKNFIRDKFEEKINIVKQYYDRINQSKNNQSFEEFKENLYKKTELTYKVIKLTVLFFYTLGLYILFKYIPFTM